MTPTTNRLATVASFAIATAALGQGTMAFSWTVEDTGNHDGIIEPGESAILTLWAYMDPEEVGLALTIYDIAGDGNWQTRGTIDARTSFIDDPGTGPGELHADNSITGIESFHWWVVISDNFDPSNPLALYEIVWTPSDYGVWNIEFWSENHQYNWVYTDDFGSAEEYDAVIEPGSMRIVPGSGGVVVLGLAVLGQAARRRRDDHMLG